MIVCENVRKTYVVQERRGLFRRGLRRTIEALCGIDLEIRKGEFVGLLGPNGAGKTTLIKILCTLLLPSSGRVYVAGFDVLENPFQVRRKIGVVLSGERTLYWKLTAWENLLLFAGLYNISKKEARQRATELLELVGLASFAHVPAEKFSTGMRKRLAIARALMHNPTVLLLDEPTSGLDPHGVEEVWQVLRNLREQGVTVLMATHNMLEAERVPTRLVIIDQGQIVADGTPAEIIAQAHAESKAAIIVRGEIPPHLGVAAHPLEEGQKLLLVSLPQLPSVLTLIQKNGLQIVGVEVKESGLWEAFLSLTGRPFDDVETVGEEE